MKRSRRLEFSRAVEVKWICLFLAVAGAGFGDTPHKPVSVADQKAMVEQKAKAELLSLPLSFEANRGQTDRAVKFLSRGSGYALFLTADSAVFKLRSSRKGSSAAVVRMKLAGANSGAEIDGAEALPGTVNYFMGNDPNRWTTGIPTFGKVNYRQVYRGIDLVYYGTGRQLEYDFIVAPGSDPKQIALEFAGARPTFGADGDLLLTLDGAPLILRKPVVYQVEEKGNRSVVAASYKLNGDRVQFRLGKYDHKRALVIDPVLVYLTYLGGSLSSVVGNTTYGGNPTQSAVVDATGNVYVTGYTQSTDFPVLNAIQAANTANGYKGFITKLNPAGSQLVYSTYIGGSVFGDGTGTEPYAIAVDSSGNAYIAGFTNSPKFPATAGAYQTACGFVGTNGMSNCPGAQSAFLTKLSPTGGLVYSTFFGHSNETAVAVAVDSHGQAYIAGDTVDQCTALSGGNAVGPAVCFPTTANAVLPGSTFNTTLNPNNFNQGSAFISVFDAAGANLLYSSLFGGNGNQAQGNGHPTYGSGVAVDASGYFYLVGTTGSNQLPVTPGAFQTTYYGNPTPGFSTATRGFVAKFKPISSGASLLYTTYLGGTDPTQLAYQDFVAGIAADAAGNAYVSGNASYDFPVTAGAYDTTPCPYTLCENRNFLAKLNPTGSALVWATFVGNMTRPDLSAADTISPPRLDAQGNVYVSGNAGDNTEVPLLNPLQPANGFGGAYVTEYNPTASAINFSTVIYGPASNGGIFDRGVDVDAQGNMYVAGYTSQPSLPTTAGAFQTAINGTGTTDGFIAKIQPSASVPAITASGGVGSGASFQAGIVPNSWISIVGSNLSSQTDNWTNAVVNGALPTSLDGVKVSIGGLPAYIELHQPWTDQRAGSQRGDRQRIGHGNQFVGSQFTGHGCCAGVPAGLLPMGQLRRRDQSGLQPGRQERHFPRCDHRAGQARRYHHPLGNRFRPDDSLHTGRCRGAFRNHLQHGEPGDRHSRRRYGYRLGRCLGTRVGRAVSGSDHNSHHAGERRLPRRGDRRGRAVTFEHSHHGAAISPEHDQSGHTRHSRVGRKDLTGAAGANLTSGCPSTCCRT